MHRFRKQDLFTIPNLMSYARILLIPLFCWLYLTAETLPDYFWASAVVLLSSLTDLFDGKIARRFHMVTELGKVLDPVADKLTHAALAVCLATRYPLMWALLALMVLKEGYMGIMGIRFLRKDQMLDGAQWFGKVCTAVLFVGLMILFLFPTLPLTVVNTLIALMMLVMVVTLALYVPVFRRMRQQSQPPVA